MMMRDSIANLVIYLVYLLEQTLKNEIQFNAIRFLVTMTRNKAIEQSSLRLSRLQFSTC
jgi:hypothetical protein